MKELFKTYCKNRIISLGLARYVDVSEEENEFGEGVTYCAFDGGGYFCRVYMTDDGFISHELSWDGVDFEHDIEDVFLLFDIDDFKDYYYDNCIVESRIKAAVDEIVGMLFTYAHDIQRAGEGNHYDRLLTAQNVTNSGKGPSLRRILKNGRLHDKMVKTRSDKDRERYIADLEKWEQKGWLSEYGKRDLNRLKRGYIDEEYDDSHEWENVYTRYYILAVFIFTLISFVICFGIQWFSRAVFLRDGLFIYGSMSRMCTVFAAILLTVILSYLFAVKLAVRFVPEKFREYETGFKEKISEEYHSSKLEKVLVRGALVLAAVVALPLLMSIGTANYSFYDDHFDAHFFFSNTSVNYTDCTVYLVKGEYDKHDEYRAYSYPYYYIEYDRDGDTITEDIGQVKSPDKQRQIKEIFDNNSIEIKSIKNIEE